MCALKLKCHLSFLLSYLILTSWSIKKHSGGKYQLKLECKLGFVSTSWWAETQQQRKKPYLLCSSSLTSQLHAVALLGCIYNLTQAEICNLGIPLLVEQYVSRLFPKRNTTMKGAFSSREAMQQIHTHTSNYRSPSNHSEWYPDVLHRLKGYSDISSH